MKHILCDVDGVVINGYHVDPLKRVSWSKDLEKDFGIKVADMERIFFHGPFVQIMEGKIGLVDGLKSVFPELGYSGDAEKLIDYWFKKDSNINTEFIDWVKSKKNGKYTFSLATNQEHRRADYLWNSLGLNEHFEEIFYAAKIGYKKPDKFFFEHILDKIKIPSSDIFFIDDCPKNVEMAKVLGINSVVFNSMDDVLNHPFMNES